MTEQTAEQKMFANLTEAQAAALYEHLDTAIKGMEEDLPMAQEDYDNDEDYAAHVAFLEELKGIMA